MKPELKYYFFFLLFPFFVNGQSPIIVENTGIVYAKDNSMTDALKEKYSLICKKHIQNFYPEGDLPLVYIIINTNRSDYELAYDNLSGDSVNNDDIDRYSKYYLPGIRITVPFKESNKDALIKLLDYGVNNLSELKKIREEAMRLKYYDRPDNLSISEAKIKSILRKKS